jgi:hypothetical protein
LHEIGGESTRSGAWSWHSGVLSVPGFFGEFISFYKKSAVTTTLIVKRTTKFAFRTFGGNVALAR